MMVLDELVGSDNLSNLSRVLFMAFCGGNVGFGKKGENLTSQRFEGSENYYLNLYLLRKYGLRQLPNGSGMVHQPVRENLPLLHNGLVVNCFAQAHAKRR